MTRCATRLLTLGILATAALLPHSARATVLTFNIDNFPAGTAAATASLIGVHPGYGDNVSSTVQTGVGPGSAFTYNYGMGNGFTPNVTVAYSLGTGGVSHLYYTDSGSPASPLWTDVDFLNGGTPGTQYFTFVPATDLGVKVNSFDVFGYNASLTHTYSWKLRADSTAGTILASGGPTAFTGAIASPNTVTTGLGGYFGTLVLEIDHTAGSGGAWGLDNLNFDQVKPVPEPATWLLLGLGSLGLVWRVRRKKFKV